MVRLVVAAPTTPRLSGACSAAELQADVQNGGEWRTRIPVAGRPNRFRGGAGALVRFTLHGGRQRTRTSIPVGSNRLPIGRCTSAALSSCKTGGGVRTCSSTAVSRRFRFKRIPARWSGYTSEEYGPRGRTLTHNPAFEAQGDASFTTRGSEIEMAGGAQWNGRSREARSGA